VEIFKQKIDGRSAEKVIQGSSPADASRTKRIYERPALTRWGSMMDLTQGPLGGFDDVENGASQQV
jgi:hypothetical protein